MSEEKCIKYVVDWRIGEIHRCKVETRNNLCWCDSLCSYIGKDIVHDTFKDANQSLETLKQLRIENLEKQIEEIKNIKTKLIDTLHNAS